LQDLEDNFAPDIPPNQSPVIFNCAQLIVNGVISAFGVLVASLAAMESNLDPDISSAQQSVVGEIVQESRVKLETVQRILAQLTANGMTLENGVTAARIVVVDGNGDQEL